MMHVLGLSEFAKLPAGTVYSAYDPDIVRGLFVKGETIQSDPNWPADFFETEVIPQHIDAHGAAIGGRCRWGEMDVDAQFVVYDADDVAAMMNLLASAL